MQVDFIQAVEKLLTVHNVQLTRVTPPFEGLDQFDHGLRRALDPQFDWQNFGESILHNLPHHTLLLLEGVFELHFAMFRLPDEEDVAYIAGPWITGPRSEKSIEWSKKNLTEEGNRAVTEYYNAVQLLPEETIGTELRALLALVYPSDKFEVVVNHEFMPLNFRLDLRVFSEPAFSQGIPAAMLEQRYQSENAMLEAVARGDSSAAFMAMQSSGRFQLEERFNNPLRHRKNLAIIFNTLLRKSIEKASVHPYYIDRISTKYALRIEALTNEKEYLSLVRDMVKEYCIYVQKYSLRNYSPLVQKVINHINLNLDTPLSLKSMAAMCYISPSYLSNIFKQETNQTLTDYINTQRIHRAAGRLARSDLPIAAVAESVGIFDVNYFTKMFKKTMGTTPTQYRRENRER